MTPGQKRKVEGEESPVCSKDYAAEIKGSFAAGQGAPQQPEPKDSGSAQWGLALPPSDTSGKSYMTTTGLGTFNSFLAK